MMGIVVPKAVALILCWVKEAVWEQCGLREELQIYHTQTTREERNRRLNGLPASVRPLLSFHAGFNEQVLTICSGAGEKKLSFLPWLLYWTNVGWEFLTYPVPIHLGLWGRLEDGFI